MKNYIFILCISFLISGGCKKSDTKSSIPTSLPNLSLSLFGAPTKSTATLNITINSTTVGISDQGLVFGLTSNPTVNQNTKKFIPLQSNSFSNTLQGLIPGKTYYIRAYATNSAGTAYSNEITINTIPNSVVTIAATNIGRSSATLSGKLNGIIDNTTVQSVECGIELSRGPQFNYLPTYIGTIRFSPQNNSFSNFSLDLLNQFNPGTTYYYRAYIQLSVTEVYYGEMMQFTTSQ